MELTDEREAYVRTKHPEVFAGARDYLRETLDDPEVVQRDRQHPGTRLFGRWYDDLVHGEYLIVAVVSDTSPSRHWIVTAFVARRLGRGAIEWQR